MLPTRCPHCGSTAEIDERLAGHELLCQHCQIQYTAAIIVSPILHLPDEVSLDIDSASLSEQARERQGLDLIKPSPIRRMPSKARRKSENTIVFAAAISLCVFVVSVAVIARTSSNDSGDGQGNEASTEGATRPLPAGYTRFIRRQSKTLPYSSTESSISLRSGSFGHFPRARVISIIDRSSILCTLIYAGDYDFNRQTDAIVRGVDTSNVVDGEIVSFVGVFEVNGTCDYTTVLGASRRVYELSSVKSEDAKRWNRQCGFISQ